MFKILDLDNFIKPTCTMTVLFLLFHEKQILAHSSARRFFLSYNLSVVFHFIILACQFKRLNLFCNLYRTWIVNAVKVSKSKKEKHCVPTFNQQSNCNSVRLNGY